MPFFTESNFQKHLRTMHSHVVAHHSDVELASVMDQYQAPSRIDDQEPISPLNAAYVGAGIDYPVPPAEPEFVHGGGSFGGGGASGSWDESDKTQTVAEETTQEPVDNSSPEPASEPDNSPSDDSSNSSSTD
jgi:hypothetical protein